MLPILNENFFLDLAAGLGITPVKLLTEVKMTNEEVDKKLSFLNSQNGPCFYTSTSNPPAFFNRGVMREGDTWASHNGMFIPESWADKIRVKYPDLFKTRRIRNTTTEAGILPPVPQRILEGGEMLNSQMRFAIQSTKDVVKPGEFVVFFTRDWTPEQAEAICYSAYWHYGAPYDIFEIGSYVAWWMPNLRQLRVCSTAIEWMSEGHDPNLDDDTSPARGDTEIRPWMVAKGIDPDRCAPCHTTSYWFQSPHYQKQVAFYCSLEQAKQMI
jgi:hypothetical protein